MRLQVCALLSATMLLLASCAPKVVSTIGADTQLPHSQPAVTVPEVPPESQPAAAEPATPPEAQSATAKTAAAPEGQHQHANGPASVGGDKIVLAPDDVPGTVLGSHGTIKLNSGTWYVDAQNIYDSKKNRTYYILPIKDNMLYQLNNLEKQGKVMKLKSGVRYATIKTGSGEEATGEVGETLQMQIANFCADGSPADDRSGSHSNADEIYDVEMVIGLGGGCPGWEQAVRGMKTGEIRIVEIPEELYNLEPQAARYSGKVYTQMKLLRVDF